MSISCLVYWLFDRNCFDPRFDGYIGVATNLSKRLYDHRSKRGMFDHIVLFRGSNEECYCLEKALRPHPGIGWNIAPGGEAHPGPGPSRPPMLGRKHSAKTKAKMRKAYRKRLAEGRAYHGGNGGHKHDAETREKIRQARLRQKCPRTGKRHTEETKRAQSELAKRLNETRSRDSSGRYA
jgi:hypothetical protein